MALAAAGPAQALFDKHRGNFGFTDDPHLYDYAFVGAIASNFVRQYRGVDYVTFLHGDFSNPGMPVGGWPACRAAELPEPWLANPARCRFATVIKEPECRNVDGCARLHVDPSVLAVPEYRRLIVDGLERPCAALTDPDTLSSNLERNVRARGVYFGASENWKILGCRSKRPLAASDIKIDDGTGEISFRF
jgi:hypothetical protein